MCDFNCLSFYIFLFHNITHLFFNNRKLKKKCWWPLVRQHWILFNQSYIPKNTIANIEVLYFQFQVDLWHHCKKYLLLFFCLASTRFIKQVMSVLCPATGVVRFWVSQFMWNHLCWHIWWAVVLAMAHLFSMESLYLALSPQTWSVNFNNQPWNSTIVLEVAFTQTIKNQSISGSQQKLGSNSCTHVLM